MSKTKNLISLAAFFSLLVILFSGCATAPIKENLPAYNINGVKYFPLVSLCDLRNVSWQYDTFTKTVVLSKGRHRINLLVGDKLVLVDGQPRNLNNPIELYQGAVVVPYKFKQEIFDFLFKELATSAQVSPALRKIRKVVIDAGHGGTDPGAIGSQGLREKIVVLDIAKRLSGLFRSKGIQVVMTRTTDKFIPLATRVDIANNSAADLFISVHANANRVKGLNGFEAYYISPDANDSERAMRAAKEARLDLDASSFASDSLVLKAILWDMVNTYNRAESVELARYICRDMDSNLNCRILGIKGANFQVLKGTRLPAILLEVGFVSNLKEERMLQNNYYRQQIAETIMQGLEGYIQGDLLREASYR